MTIKKKRNRKSHPAQEKVQAVLSVWMESSSQNEICKSLGISSVTLNKWQDLAMEAMLKALEPASKKHQLAVLTPRLENLLNRQIQKKLSKVSPQQPKENQS